MNPAVWTKRFCAGLVILSLFAAGRANLASPRPTVGQAAGRPVPSASRTPSSRTLSAYERTVLAIVKSIIHLFKASPGVVWPGYSLAARPFIVYIPNTWAIFLNAPGPVEGFAACPPGWPDLGTGALYHSGAYKDLAGQLAFDFEVGGIKTVAIGLPDQLPGSGAHQEASLFGFIVHEAFHQFQNDTFAEIPWEREERYPILDRDNTALACLEMRLLMDALNASYSRRPEEVKECIKEFTAVRTARWRQGDPFITRYERSQEVREGTAQYVEAKSLDVMKSLDHPPFFNSVTFPGWILDDFKGRMTKGSVSPDDMLRNRIYPVGCSLGFLADRLGIAWKDKAQKSSAEFDFAGLFKEKYMLTDELLGEFLDRAKAASAYKEILKATDALIRQYRRQYDDERADFEAQPGFRTEVEFVYRSLNRSRSSQGKRWTMDQGRISLCRHYAVYALKNADITLQIRGLGVLEEDDWDKKWKKIVFFAPQISLLAIDGKSVRPNEEGPPREFSTIELAGNGFSVTASKPGTLSLSHGKLQIVLAAPAGDR